MSKKLAIISTHPIQYYAPVFQLLAKKVALKVFYTWGQQSVYKYDHGFEQNIVWDIPLLDGYDYLFLKNKAKNQGTHHFNGIVNLNGIQKINEFAPDAILVYGWANQSHLNCLRYFKGKIPIYFRGDSTLLNQKNVLKILVRKLFLSWVYSHVDIVFYVGSANKNYYLSFGLTLKQLVFAPHSIDNKRFATERISEVLALKNRLKIGADVILILFAGKMEMIKNPQLLLQAFIELDLPNVHLLFVGNGELEESLKLKVESLDFIPPTTLPNNRDRLSEVMDEENSNNDEILRQAQNDNIRNRIHFMDFQNQTQMPVVYQACDLFCLPSKSETWGLSVNEAMAAGKAILVSDKVGCTQDLVCPKNGNIFKSGNLADLKEKLLGLTANKTKLKEMGQYGLQKITDWSFEVQANAIASYVNR